MMERLRRCWKFVEFMMTGYYTPREASRKDFSIAWIPTVISSTYAPSKVIRRSHGWPPHCWTIVKFHLDEKSTYTSITTSHRSRARTPSMRKPASKEITSASVQLWDTEVCFLHIQLIGTSVRLPKLQKHFHRSWSESSRSSAKSESWNKPNRQRCAVLPTWQYCLWSLVSFNSGPIQALQDDLRAHCGQVSNLFEFFFLEVVVVQTWSWNFVQLLSNICPRTFSHDLPYRMTTRLFLREVFPTQLIFQLLLQKLVIRTFLCIPRQHFRSVRSLWVHPKYTWSRNDVGPPRSTSFINFFHMGLKFWLFPSILMSSTKTDKNSPCFRWTNTHSQFGTFSHPRPNKTCLSHKRPANGWPVRFRSRGTTRSSRDDSNVASASNCHDVKVFHVYTTMVPLKTSRELASPPHTWHCEIHSFQIQFEFLSGKADPRVMKFWVNRPKSFASTASTRTMHSLRKATLTFAQQHAVFLATLLLDAHRLHVTLSLATFSSLYCAFAADSCQLHFTRSFCSSIIVDVTCMNAAMNASSISDYGAWTVGTFHRKTFCRQQTDVAQRTHCHGMRGRADYIFEMSARWPCDPFVWKGLLTSCVDLSFASSHCCAERNCDASSIIHSNSFSFRFCADNVCIWSRASWQWHPRHGSVWKSEGRHRFVGDYRRRLHWDFISHTATCGHPMTAMCPTFTDQEVGGEWAWSVLVCRLSMRCVHQRSFGTLVSLAAVLCFDFLPWLSSLVETLAEFYWASIENSHVRLRFINKAVRHKKQIAHESGIQRYQHWKATWYRWQTATDCRTWNDAFLPPQKKNRGTSQQRASSFTKRVWDQNSSQLHTSATRLPRCTHMFLDRLHQQWK